jgi:hypothetical protein
MNPGKVSFMNLYAYRSNTEKTESRVGRAVWCAMHALNEGSKNMKDRQAGATDARKNGAVGSDEQDAEADIDQGEEQDEDDEDEDDVDSELDSDDFGAQISLLIPPSWLGAETTSLLWGMDNPSQSSPHGTKYPLRPTVRSP